jgi:predicted transcriptional regulator
LDVLFEFDEVSELIMDDDFVRLCNACGLLYAKKTKMAAAAAAAASSSGTPG